MFKTILPTGETLVIREAQVADAVAMIRHAQQVGDETDFLTFSGSQLQKTLAEEVAIIREHQAADNRIFIVAEIDGTLVGMGNIMASAKPRMRHFGELGLSVEQTHWRKGIGQQMILYFIRWAKANSVIRKLNLEVQANNTGAIHLYHKLGFQEEGRLRRGSFVKGRFYDLLIMGMCID